MSNRLDYIPMNIIWNEIKYPNFSIYYSNPLLDIIVEDNYIIKFMELAFKDNFLDVLDWLSNYFKTLNKSDSILVLIGDSETTDIFVNNIIKPIFAKRKEYILNINDAVLYKNNNLEVKDKIFYHFDDISEKHKNNKKLKDILIEISKERLLNLAHNFYKDYTISSFYGEIIITADKNNPYSFLEKCCYNSCSVFSVRDLDSVLKNLNIDLLDLHNNIVNDLYNFSQILVNNKYQYKPIYNTEEKRALPYMKKGILLTPTLDKKIDNFILAIENKDINYFSNIKKEDEELYQELIENFEEDMIAQPLLSRYFNLIENENIFSDNSYFIDILKRKDKMFINSPNDKSKRNGNKRYSIPSSSIVFSLNYTD